MGSTKWKIVVALVSVALLAGCGREAEPAKPAPAPITTPPSTSTSSAAPSSSATPSSSPKPTAPPAVADGRNLKACSDGACEVEVKAGDVIRFGKQVKSTPKISYVAVMSTGADGIYFQLDSSFGGSINGTVTLNNAVTIEMLYSDVDHAMIRISLVS